MRDLPATRSRRRAATLAALTALILILAACGASSSGSEAPNDGKSVTISGRSFGSAEITVTAGNVTFVNEDGTSHIVAEGENGSEAASPRITKATIAGGAQAEIAFDAPGDYNVTCLIHGSMNMVVHVQ